MSKTKISVIMPAYNAGRYIAESIKSILNSNYENIELIIINDGSIDDTEAIVKSFKDSRIHLINNNINQGIVYSLNKGIIEAEGKFIARMDADDISFPNRFTNQLEILISKDLDIISSCAITTNKVSKRFIGIKLNLDELRLALAFFNPIVHPLVMGTAEIFKNNLYDNNFQHAEDYELWSRLVLNGARFHTTSDILLKYRVHAGQISKTKHNHQKITRDSISANYINSVNVKFLNRQYQIIDHTDPFEIIQKFIESEYINTKSLSHLFIDKLYIELALENKIYPSIYNLENFYITLGTMHKPSNSLRLSSKILNGKSLVNNTFTRRLINRIYR